VVPGGEVEPDPTSIEPLTQFVRHRLPGLLPAPHMPETCLYASTPDDDFVIDRIGNIVLGLGFGGHGFKFAPVVGEMLAKLVDGTAIEFPDRFTRQRFGSGPGMVTNAG
jgi:sarcosine oxidase